MALEGSQRFALGLAFADAAVEIGTGFGLVFGADDRDRVDRVIDLAIAAAVEPVSDGLARGVSSAGARVSCWGSGGRTWTFATWTRRRSGSASRQTGTGQA